MTYGDWLLDAGAWWGSNKRKGGYARAMSQYLLHGVYVMQQDGIVCDRRLQRIDVDPDFSN